MAWHDKAPQQASLKPIGYILVLFGMQNWKFGPYLADINTILISLDTTDVLVAGIVQEAGMQNHTSRKVTNRPARQYDRQLASQAAC
jgi:hypothetical protein